MQYKKFRESEGLASLSRALRASHQEKPLADTVKPKDDAHLGEPSKPKKAKRHADAPSPGDAADAKAKKRRKKVKPSPDDAGQAQHLLQTTLAQSEEQEVDGLPEPRQLHAVARQPMKELGEAPERHDRESAGAQSASAHTPQTRTFRDYYVDMFTSAFSTDLYDLQQVEGEALQLPLLLRCIEQGGNLFSDIEKDLLCRDKEAALQS